MTKPLLQARVEPELLKALDDLAAARGLTRQDLVRAMIVALVRHGRRSLLETVLGPMDAQRGAA